MSGLEVVGLEKAFDTQAVLRGIDLTVPSGSFCSILGPSGSGKTTLLRVIAGFERADAGAIRLDGAVLDEGERFVPPNRRRIGYVPQEGSLFPHLTVAGNVGFGLPRAERRGGKVAALLELVGLAGYERRYPHQLSGGQQQRVALARALAIDPTLVLLDEPFSSLDASLRQSVRQEVREVLARANATVLLVTHDQDEALSLSDAVAVIADGRIGQVDTPARLYADPASPALARGLGEANLLPALAAQHGVTSALGTLDLRRRRPMAPGTDLVVLVRPEQLVIVPAGEGSLEASVVASEYYGHDAVVRLRASELPGAVLVARVAEASTLPTPGATVGLRVRGEVVGWPRAELAPEAPRGELSPRPAPSSRSPVRRTRRGRRPSPGRRGGPPRAG